MTTESTLLDPLPPFLRKAFESIVGYYINKARQADLDPAEFDKMLAEHGDLLVQLRSDDAMPMRVVAFKDDNTIELFRVFLQNRDAIMAALPKEAVAALEAPKNSARDQDQRAENDAEALTEEPRDQGPGESGTQETFDFGTVDDD